MPADAPEIRPKSKKATDRNNTSKDRKLKKAQFRKSRDFKPTKSTDSGSKKSTNSGSKKSTDSGSKKSSDSGSKKSSDSGPKTSSDSGPKTSTDSGSREPTDSRSREPSDSESRESSDSESRRPTNSGSREPTDSESMMPTGHGVYTESIRTFFQTDPAPPQSPTTATKFIPPLIWFARLFASLVIVTIISCNAERFYYGGLARAVHVGVLWLCCFGDALMFYFCLFPADRGSKNSSRRVSWFSGLIIHILSQVELMVVTVYTKEFPLDMMTILDVPLGMILIINGSLTVLSLLAAVSIRSRFSW